MKLTHIKLAVLLLMPFLALAQEVQDKKVKLSVKNEESINTDGIDFSPSFYEDGIVFISSKMDAKAKPKAKGAPKGKSYVTIMRSTRDMEGALAAPQLFAQELIGSYNEGPVCFDRTGETVYFSANVSQKKGKKNKASKKGQIKMALYSATRVGGKWSEPVQLPFSTGEFDDMHPAISIDGDMLIFASNREGGQGKMDLWASYKVGDAWGAPVNLSTVNSASDEAFPFIHADNTLYFASDVAGGSGGLDLYFVVHDGDKHWTTPVNMGQPFNTSGDDFGLIVDLNKINGYYSSSGSGGKGQDDIFSFYTENGNLDDFLLQQNRIADRMLDLQVTVLDRKTYQPLSMAEVKLLNYDQHNVIGRDEEGNYITIQEEDGKDVLRPGTPDPGIEGETDRRGFYTTDVRAGNYAITVSKDGYQPKQLRVPITKPGNNLEILMDRGAPDGQVRWSASVFNTVTNAPMSGTTMVITNQRTGKKDTLVTDANGIVDHYLDPNTKYKVDLYQGKRIIGTTEINTTGYDGANQILMQNISVAPFLSGDVVDLPNIYYNFNDAKLRPDARKDLRMLAALLKQQPDVTVELASHTDCRGSAAYNQDLSQRRANGVVDYLVAQGVSRDRLKPVGYGESQPRNKCVDGVPCTEAEHAQNRRTEMRVLTGGAGNAIVRVDGRLPGSTGGVGTTGNVQVSPADNAEYHVVAGSFLMPERAENHLRTVQSGGFPDAAIVRFPNSEFYSISVGSFSTRKEAFQLKKALNRAKFEAFVRPNSL